MTGRLRASQREGESVSPATPHYHPQSAPTWQPLNRPLERCSLEDRHLRLASARAARVRRRQPGGYEASRSDQCRPRRVAPRMDRVLAAGFKVPASESVLIQSRASGAGAPTFDAAVKDVVARLAKVAAVKNVRSPLDPGNARPDRERRACRTLVEFEDPRRQHEGDGQARPDPRECERRPTCPSELLRRRVRRCERGQCREYRLCRRPEERGRRTDPAHGAVILVVAFVRARAAGIPLLLALTDVFATFGLAALPSHVLPLAPEAFAVVLLVGLAVGVDYSMFYLRREREERAAGQSEARRARSRCCHLGPLVPLINGLTVMVAMAGLFLTGDATFASFGYATMIVVGIAMIGSLTVLPALLSRLGDRVDRLQVPLVGRLRRDGGEGRVWGVIVDRVLRRPLLSAVIAGGLLLALAVPALQMRMATPGPDTFPKSLDVVKTYNRMQQDFPGTALPASVVVQASDINAPAVRRAIGRLKIAAIATGHARGPITVDTNDAGTIANITVPILGKGTDAQSNASLAALREDVVPPADPVGALPNVEVGVTGLTAEWKDAKDQLKSKLPLVVGFVLLLAFVLMLVAFRSIVVAIKAIVAQSHVRRCRVRRARARLPARHR